MIDQRQLKTWERLEPKRCRYVRGPVLSAQLFLGGQWHNVVLIGQSGRAILQASLQEAIDEHGWEWEISSWGVGKYWIEINATADLQAPYRGGSRTVEDLADGLLALYVFTLEVVSAKDGGNG